jgi:hypothetical protein
MPLFLQVGATAICPHGGQISVIPTNVRVTAGGQPIAVLADTFLVAGCVFTVPPGKPQPCTTVQWLVPAARVTIGGQPAILQSSSGLCLSADMIPAGPPNVVVTQVRAQGQ